MQKIELTRRKCVSKDNIDKYNMYIYISKMVKIPFTEVIHLDNLIIV